VRKKDRKKGALPTLEALIISTSISVGSSKKARNCSGLGCWSFLVKVGSARRRATSGKNGSTSTSLGNIGRSIARYSDVWRAMRK